MSEMWKRWEGQVIDHKYQLRQFLGSTDHSAVFCAEFRDPELRKAAVKFLAADLPHAGEVLAAWKLCQKLRHPNLITIYSSGRCRIEDMDLIYAAMEYADENLGEILPHRALAAPEAQEMLGVLADVLVYLHGNKLTHGHVKPSNIFAIGDQLKVSSDTVEPLAIPREMRRKRDVYDAPETPASAFTPAADVWSVGVTLVEALAQQPVVLPFNEAAEPVVPPFIREPFREIATHALLRDPNARWSSVDIAVRLNPEAEESIRAALAAATEAVNRAAMSAEAPKSAAAKAASAVAVAPPASAVAAAASAAAQSSATPALAPTAGAKIPPAVVSPLSVPLSKEPAVPLAKQPSGKVPSQRPPMPPPQVSRTETKPPSRNPIVLPNYLVPVLAAVLLIVGAIALPKFLHRSTTGSVNSAPSQSASPAAPAANQPSSTAASAAPSVAVPHPASKTSSNVPTANAPNSPLSSAQTPAATVPSAPPSSAAVLHDSGTAPAAESKNAAGSERGEVLDRVLPRPAASALATIQGTVRVAVRVHVDPAGNVADATLQNAGPSRYFAEMSLKAARGWVFLAPTSEGHSEETEWLIRFEFTAAGVNAYPSQVRR